MLGAALMSWIATAGVGLLMFVVYAITDVTALAWCSCAILAFVAAWGVRNFFLWQQRRLGVLKATAGSWNVPPPIAANPHLPAEQHFPVAVVVLHGLLGVVTLTLSVPRDRLVASPGDHAGWYGGATPQPQRGTGACGAGSASGAEFSTASRVPHSA